MTTFKIGCRYIFYFTTPTFPILYVVKYLAEKGADTNQINSERCKRYLLFCYKMKIKAQKKIYYWWIEICYNLHHHSGCGKRMAERNWKSFEDEVKKLKKS